MVDAVAQRGDARHRWLQDEAEGHCTAGPGHNIPPEAIQLFGRNAVHDDASDHKAEAQHDGYTRREDREIRWRINHRTDVPRTRTRVSTCGRLAAAFKKFIGSLIQPENDIKWFLGSREGGREPIGGECAIGPGVLQ